MAGREANRKKKREKSIVESKEKSSFFGKDIFSDKNLVINVTKLLKWRNKKYDDLEWVDSF